MKDLRIIIEELIAYAKVHLDLGDLDAVYVRNLLLHKLHVSAPYEGEVDTEFVKDLIVPDVIVEELKEVLIEQGDENADLTIVDIMGTLTPMPQAVADKVLKLEKEEAGKGLDYLFNLEIKNNYIQKTAIDKNIYFRKDYEDNFL